MLKIASERKKTKLLTLFLLYAQNSTNADYFHKLTNGIFSTVVQKGYNLLIRQQTADEKFRDILLSSDSDGFIIIAPTLNSFVIKELEITKRPVVVINGRSPYLNWVDLDNISAGLQLTEHLIKLGHKEIAFIGGIKSNLNTHDRFKGYQLALVKHRMVFDPNLVFYADYEKIKAYELVKNIDSNKMTAIFACNDLMAIGAINAIREKGLKVPENIAVVGFDDIEIGESFYPPLTTIRQPLSNMGKIAVELLIEQIEKIKGKSKGKKVKNVELKGELIIRKSCGAKQ
ncbi:MAG: substrate-binding domain-containing protein [Elusimicrobia bacterium]|nr:substrate-binding domain-containing protein [Elusimicrobiota bacterium]